MIIETKFDLDQLVWYLHDGKIQKGIITCITPRKHKDYQTESYNVSLGDCGHLINKNKEELFETRELFIKSIQ